MTTLSAPCARFSQTHTIQLPPHLAAGSYGQWRHITVSRTHTGGWSVSYHYSTSHYSTAREAMARVREIITGKKRRLGQQAVDRAWDGLCGQMAGQARLLRTARDLLRDEICREELRAIAVDGRNYTSTLDQYATRKVIAEARQVIAQRHDRTADRQQADAARSAEAGRYVRQAAQNSAQRRERQRQSVQEVVADISARLYRTSNTRWAGGEHFTHVSLSETGGVGAAGDSERVWSGNNKWSGNNSVHRYTVPADWMQSVHDAGLAEIDGQLTLRAEKASKPGLHLDGCWAVVTVKQSRGFDLRATSQCAVKFAGCLGRGNTAGAAKRKALAALEALLGRPRSDAERALVEECLSQRKSNDARAAALVYADWLEERGDERAAPIRQTVDNR